MDIRYLKKNCFQSKYNFAQIIIIIQNDYDNLILPVDEFISEVENQCRNFYYCTI